MDQSDYVRIVDAAHNAVVPDEEWLRDLLAALRPALDRGLGVVGWFHELRALPAVPPLAVLDAPVAEMERLRLQSGRQSGDMLRAAMCTAPVTTLRATIGAAALEAVLGGAAVDAMIADAVGLFCMDIDGHGLGIAAHSSRVVEMSARERHRLQRVVAHLTAAFRLRRRRGAAEAVVSPSGKIAHAEGPARSQRAREALRVAAVDFDRARARGRDADEALDLHRALVAGRWTLVDTFEKDGKRYLIARHNTPSPPAAPELSVRETQVAVFAAMGHPLKMIAYELGLSESSVAAYLRRALVKLRLPDRLALARRFGFLASAPSGGADGGA